MIIITGVSRGVGKAIAEFYLNQGEKVVGLGRSSNLEHKNYSFNYLDLSDIDSISKLSLQLDSKVTLINNAGIIGNIQRISDQKDWDLEKVIRVNTVAPMLLANHIYSQVESKNDFTLVNISSGAGFNSIPSWGAYCASKAALIRLSENFYLEEREKNIQLKVYSVSPGVIDTDMQLQIRNSKSTDFSSHNKFVDLKENNALFSPETCAQKLNTLLNQPFDEKVFYDLRDF